MTVKAIKIRMERPENLEQIPLSRVTTYGRDYVIIISTDPGRDVINALIKKLKNEPGKVKDLVNSSESLSTILYASRVITKIEKYMTPLVRWEYGSLRQFISEQSNQKIQGLNDKEISDYIESADDKSCQEKCMRFFEQQKFERKLTKFISHEVLMQKNLLDASYKIEIFIRWAWSCYDDKDYFIFYPVIFGLLYNPVHRVYEVLSAQKKIPIPIQKMFLTLQEKYKEYPSLIKFKASKIKSIYISPFLENLRRTASGHNKKEKEIRKFLLSYAGQIKLSSTCIDHANPYLIAFQAWMADPELDDNYALESVLLENSRNLRVGQIHRLSQKKIEEECRPFSEYVAEQVNALSLKIDTHEILQFLESGDACPHIKPLEDLFNRVRNYFSWKILSAEDLFQATIAFEIFIHLASVSSKRNPFLFHALLGAFESEQVQKIYRRCQEKIVTEIQQLMEDLQSEKEEGLNRKTWKIYPPQSIHIMPFLNRLKSEGKNQESIQNLMNFLEEFKKHLPKESKTNFEDALIKDFQEAPPAQSWSMRRFDRLEKSDFKKDIFEKYRKFLDYVADLSFKITNRVTAQDITNYCSSSGEMQKSMSAHIVKQEELFAKLIGFFSSHLTEDDFFGSSIEILKILILGEVSLNEGHHFLLNVLMQTLMHPDNLEIFERCKIRLVEKDKELFSKLYDLSIRIPQATIDSKSLYIKSLLKNIHQGEIMKQREVYQLINKNSAHFKAKNPNSTFDLDDPVIKAWLEFDQLKS